MPHATVKSTKTDIIKVWLWALAVICCHPPLSQICSHSGWNCILVHGSRSWCAGDTWNAISAKRTQSSSLWKLFLSILWYISEQRLMHCGSIAFAQTSWCGEQSVMWRNHFRSKGCRCWHHFLRCKLKTKHYFSWHLSIITLFPLHNIFYYIIPCTLFTTSLCMPMPYGSCNIRTLNFELWTLYGLWTDAIISTMDNAGPSCWSRFINTIFAVVTLQGRKVVRCVQLPFVGWTLCQVILVTENEVSNSWKRANQLFRHTNSLLGNLGNRNSYSGKP